MENQNYTIRRLPEDVESLSLSGEFKPEQIPAPWAALDEARLDHHPWAGAYKPECIGRVGWNQKGLHVLMYGYEPVIRAMETKIGGDVYLDSCLEFFVGFDPQRPLYVNCESNPLCVMHIGVGNDRYGRTVYDHIPQGFHPTHSDHNGGWWAVSYTIPADFIQKHFGVTLCAGMPLRGNFYSCGNFETHSHYGMFKPYKLEKPDYHRPELFADFVLGD